LSRLPYFDLRDDNLEKSLDENQNLKERRNKPSSNKDNSEEEDTDIDDELEELGPGEKNPFAIFETELAIYIHKPQKPTMFINCSLKRNLLTITRSYFLNEQVNFQEHQTLFKKDLLKNLHNGITFNLISEEVHNGLREYLIVLGFNPEFIFHIQNLAFTRENELYQKWLVDFQNFLEI
jgi:hypothetical protein